MTFLFVQAWLPNSIAARMSERVYVCRCVINPDWSTTLSSSNR